MKKVLIANRGEIACRIIRSCNELGLATVAVYSEADRNALHVAAADEAVAIGGPAAKESYLRAEKLLAAAKETGADAMHPGYGFLAENPRFAEAVEKSGLIWIGPRPKTIEDMGDKERARALAKAAGLPILPGSSRFQPGDLGGLEAAAEQVGYPLLVKASAGGGGIGMQRVDDAGNLLAVVEKTQALANSAFGDGTVFLERLVAKARHVEVQMFGIGEGHVVHLYERECSIQRRFQKIIEETPAPGLDEAVREDMARAAVALATQERYHGAGTVEFVVDAEAGAFYFLEMNTRIQVEHPVTEETTGTDIVALQLRLAAGEDLSELGQESVRRSGHAIECRIYAENPQMNFLPSPGKLKTLAFPGDAEGVRVDSGVRQGDEITFHYDPMIAKLIGYGDDRRAAIERTLGALRQTRLEGPKTNISFLIATLQHPAFVAGDTHTRFVDQHKTALLAT